jgi:HEAT repeat protein
VALATQRLQSFHSNTRKDAAYELGRLGDPRAVPSLINVLKHDSSKDVRVASAISLGEIGGSDSAVALERCAIYDHKDEVRKAATNALERLNARVKSAPPFASQAAPSTAAPVPPATSTPFRDSAPPLEPSLPQAEASASPPPPPTPVTSGPGAAANN